MYKLGRRISANEDGATAIEYGLIAAFIGLVIITACQVIGIELISVFNDVAAGFKGG